MLNNRIPLYLEICGRNKAAAVYSNFKSQLVVLRWESHSNLAHMLDMTQLALREAADGGADTLVYDMRKLPDDEGLTNDLMARLHCVNSPVIRQVGWLTSGAAPAQALAPVTAAAEQHGVTACSGTTFDEVARALDALPSRAAAVPLLGPKPFGFTATYSGAWYTLPELGATVLRTAGTVGDLPLATQMFRDCLALHCAMDNSSLLVDSCASPMITDLERYIQVYQELIVPLGTSGRFKQAIHIRAGDALFPEGAPLPGPLITSFGVPFYEVNSMEDALSLLHVLKGKTRPSVQARTIPVSAENRP